MNRRIIDTDLGEAAKLLEPVGEGERVICILPLKHRGTAAARQQVLDEIGALEPEVRRLDLKVRIASRIGLGEVPDVTDWEQELKEKSLRLVELKDLNICLSVALFAAVRGQLVEGGGDTLPPGSTFFFRKGWKVVAPAPDLSADGEVPPEVRFILPTLLGLSPHELPRALRPRNGEGMMRTEVKFVVLGRL